MGYYGAVGRYEPLGTTVMVVTHNNEIVNQMQKRVVTLHEGVIISDQIQEDMCNENTRIRYQTRVQKYCTK